MRIRKITSMCPLLAWGLCMALSGLAGCGEAPPEESSPADHSRNRPPLTGRPHKTTSQKPSATLPRFTEIAQTAGVDFQRYDDIRGQHRILEAPGGGVAVFDYDGDDRLDVFFTNGCRLPRNPGDRSHPNELFRNAGGRFVRITAQAGLLQYGYCHGAAVGDFDSDGFDDLYVTAFGANAMWRNNGDGTFTEVTAQTRTNTTLWSTSAAFADFNGDAHLDLYVVNYLDTGDDPPRLCPEPAAPDGYIQCPPELFTAAQDVLFLADGRGSFRNVTEQAGVTAPDGKGLGVVVFDADGDRRPDIYVANDGTPNFLYLQQRSAERKQAGREAPREAADDADQRALPVRRTSVPKFEESGTAWGAGLNFHGSPEAGMGIACGDYDRDGWPDLFVTHFYLETNTLYRNLSGRGFHDVTVRTGLAWPSRRSLGWGTEFIDCDNDGWLDLFVANGHVDDRSWRGEPYRMKPQFFRNERDGRFIEVSQWAGSYFQKRWAARGAALIDLDNDGNLDLVVSHQLAPSAVLRNDTDTGATSVILRLLGGPQSNRSAIGASVEAEGLDRPLLREVLGGGSFQSASDRRVHIGLGGRASIPRLRITWPSGRRNEWPNVAPGRYVVVEGKTMQANIFDFAIDSGKDGPVVQRD